MRSHSYSSSFREWAKVLGAPILGATLLAAGLHGASRVGLLPLARPIDNPDETFLSFKSQLSCSRHPAQVILLGDSSCATGINALKLRAVLPGNPVVLNLGLFIGFGLDIHGEVLGDYMRRNPDQARLIVFLVTPEFLTDENAVPKAYESWRRLHLQEQYAGGLEHRGLSWLLGAGLLKDRLLRQILYTPIQDGGVYGFSADFAQYLAGHEGSMIEPGIFHPPMHPIPARYYLAPSLERASRDFRRRLPPGVRLAIGIMPLPASLCPKDFERTRNELMTAWNHWIEADYVLTNAPVSLPDTFFATKAHLNPAGQERLTRQLGALLKRVCGEFHGAP